MHGKLLLPTTLRRASASCVLAAHKRVHRSLAHCADERANRAPTGRVNIQGVMQPHSVRWSEASCCALLPPASSDPLAPPDWRLSCVDITNAYHLSVVRLLQLSRCPVS